MKLTFPEGFLWGTATSSHQVEGGNTNNDWWAFEQRPDAIWHGDRSGDACGWWEDAEPDLDLMARLGQNTHRLSVEWSRIEPEPGAFCGTALDHYREILADMRRRGIEPMVTLHHFGTPLWLAEVGGWTASECVERFSRYARRVAEELGDLVTLWCPINEPAIYAAEAYVFGIHAPGRTSLVEAGVVLRNMLAAHAEAHREMHEARPDAMVGFVKNIRLFDPAVRRNPLDRLLAWAVDLVFNQLALRPLAHGRLIPPLGLGRRVGGLAGSADFIGVNYYTRDLVSFAPMRPGDLFMRRTPTPRAEISDSGRDGPYGEVYPEGLYRALRMAARYGVDIYVTETGLPDADDDQRPRFLLTHLAQVHRAIADGVPVRGFYHWSLVDNFEWNEGWALRFGLVAMDERTGLRQPRPSADLYAAICRANGITGRMVERYAPEAREQMFPLA